MTEKSLNPLGQIASVVDAAGYTTRYEYAAFGELKQVTGPRGAVSTVAYNNAGYRTSLADPDLGGTQSFQMNSLGEVTEKTDAAGHATAFTYDTLGRMTSESFDGASGENAAWTYATSGTAAGQLTQAAKANGFTRTLAYNARGEPVTVTETYAGTPLTLHYGFDTLGRLASITYPATVSGSPLTVNYGYDSMGNLESVTNANTGTVYWQSDWSAAVPAVNAWGEAQAWTLGNGIHVRRDHDLATGQVSSIIAGPGENSASQVSLAYGYGALGNATSAVDILTGVSRSFGYDGLSRQTTANVNGTLFTTNYDAAGDITSRTNVGSYSYTATEPHAVTQTTLGGTPTNYAYDGAGQMSAGGSLSQIQWTRAGRAKQIVGSATTSLAYGANGTLVQKTVAGTASRYFGRLIVKIGASYRARIVANGQVIAIVNINGAGVATTDYLVHDAQGSPTALLDASGGLVARFAWNAWGELVNPATGTGSDPQATFKESLLTIGYTGHEELWNAGLVHTYARLYNPHIGLWLSPDPTVPHPFNGQSLNRYSYVLNNPMTFVDRFGFDDSSPPPPLPPIPIPTLQPIQVWGFLVINPEFARIFNSPPGLDIKKLEGEPNIFDDFGNNENKQNKKSKNPCGPQPFGATPPGNAGTPASTNSNQWSDFNRLYNPNLQNNIGAGAFTTGVVGAGVTAFVLVNVVGFPVAELSELAVLSALGGLVAAVPGGVIGYFATPPKPPPAPATAHCSQ